MRSFRGKTAVVTGAASGIGLALAQKCARAGMKVVMADVDARRLREASVPGALKVRTDVSRLADVNKLADAAWRRFGAVHLLFNNAGIAEYGPVWELPPERWKRVLGVNLYGVIHGCSVFVPRMLEQKGAAHIVNTASMAGLVTPPGAGAYSVSKHGVVALSEALVQDLAAQGARIGVSVLCPGWVATRLLASVRGADPVMRMLVAHGRSAESVAEQALQAVREGRFYVLTHPEMAPAVRRRAEKILAGEAPSVPLTSRKGTATSR